MHYRKEHILFAHICPYMKSESRFFYCSLMVGHEILLKATRGPRHEKGWKPLA